MVNLDYPLLKPLRILLLPFSVLYGLAIYVRNWLFDKKILQSARFNLPVICIGNLSVGGTGKSPMVEWLIGLLHSRYNVAVLSRGYKRKTRGYALATASSTALEIGDEPMQIHTKYPGISVAVGEERIVAIPQLLHDRPGTEVILLDDAFQHRSVAAGLNILLTDMNNLFTRDWFLPTGDLRDRKSSYHRAEVLVVTKCPTDLSLAEKAKLTKEIKPDEGQQIFFSAIRYGMPYRLAGSGQMAEGSGTSDGTLTDSACRQPPADSLPRETEVLLVTGIANPKPLKKHLEQNYKSYEELAFSDHHIFSIDDLKKIEKHFNAMAAEKKIILTTEKDAVRLVKFGSVLAGLPFYVMPIRPVILFNEEEAFASLIKTFIQDFPA